jgi:uracil-DNA glycosylase
MSDFKFSTGPKNAKLAIVGEAWGEEEDKLGMPFVGQAGRELTNLLSEAKINRHECFITNVFNIRPFDNKIDSLCGKKADVTNTLPALGQAKYILDIHLHHLERLFWQLREVRPNLVLALGNTACWALLQSQKISALRGTVTTSVVLPQQKVLPTYHPAAILRNWSLRPITLTDLFKAKRQLEFPEIRRPERFIWINPTLEEIKAWALQDHQILSVDIETKNGQITCIGFARSTSDALVIPFWNKTTADQSYWTSLSEELAAWYWVRYLLEHPAPKLFQNGLYDLQYILRMGFRPNNVLEDTMLLHHALFPELPKGLGFMGSVYTDETSWKLMRQEKELEKQDE